MTETTQAAEAGTTTQATTAETTAQTSTATAASASSAQQTTASASETTTPEVKAFSPPEFLPDYLRGKDLEDTYNRLSEFYKRHRETVSEPPPAKPEEYAYAPSEAVKTYMPDPDQDPLIMAAKQAAHKHGIPAKAFQGFVDDVLSGFIKEGNMMPPVNATEEHKKLAPEGSYSSDQERAAAGQRVLSEVTAQLETLQARGTISEAGFKEMSLLLFTADGATAVRSLLNLSNQPTVRLGDGGGVANGYSWAEYDKMMADPKYSTLSVDHDKAYRAQVNAYGDRLAQLNVPRL